MHACMHACTHVYTHNHICTYSGRESHTRICMHQHARVRAHTHAWMHGRMHGWINACFHAFFILSKELGTKNAQIAASQPQTPPHKGDTSLLAPGYVFARFPLLQPATTKNKTTTKLGAKLFAKGNLKGKLKAQLEFVECFARNLRIASGVTCARYNP